MATPVDNNTNDNNQVSDPGVDSARVLVYPANGTPARFTNLTPVYPSNIDPQLTHLNHFPDFGACWQPDGHMYSRCMKYTIQNPDGSLTSTSYVAFWSVSKQLPPTLTKHGLMKEHLPHTLLQLGISFLWSWRAQNETSRAEQDTSFTQRSFL